MRGDHAKLFLFSFLSLHSFPLASTVKTLIDSSLGMSPTDVVYGTNGSIPPGKNFTYALHVKDQIDSFFYFPSLGMQKAVVGFGSISVQSRPKIPVPFPLPTGDSTILVGD
ncbi:hypothetical protein RJT34_14215 [Clitoria ternatea]|uniref:Plastocyanin-like domain-containing protein n=1 Tax=Clitoria ternatea TaxID=43366 RepID=A0AAN9JQA0_CLITE